MAMKTLGALRDSFWENHHYVKKPGKTQNDYPIDVRMAWCDYVECMHRDGEITDALAQRATL